MVFPRLIQLQLWPPAGSGPLEHGLGPVAPEMGGLAADVEATDAEHRRPH